MGVNQTVARLMNNPLPEGRVDDILRPEGENPLLERGVLILSSAKICDRPEIARYGRGNGCHRRLDKVSSRLGPHTYDTLPAIGTRVERHEDEVRNAQDDGQPRRQSPNFLLTSLNHVLSLILMGLTRKRNVENHSYFRGA